MIVVAALTARTTTLVVVITGSKRRLNETLLWKSYERAGTRIDVQYIRTIATFISYSHIMTKTC